MNFYSIDPPNSQTLSDTVIGNVMHRTMIPPSRFIAGSDGSTLENADTEGRSTPRWPRNHPYKYSTPKRPVHTSSFDRPKYDTKVRATIAPLSSVVRTRSYPDRNRRSCLAADLKTAQEIIASIQANDPDTAKFQKLVVVEALEKKIRHREHCRINQARYRQRQKKIETEIEAAIAMLRSEIEDLETKCTDSSRLPTTPTTWTLASEYFRQFNYYVSSPERRYTTASKFLHDVMEPDVVDVSLFGVDAQLESWSLYARCFDDIHVELKGLTTPTPDTMVAGTITSVTITNNTICYAFPHLNSDGVGGSKGGVWSPLASKLLGKTLVMRGSVLFGWNNSTVKVVTVHSQADMITPMLHLLGSLEDVSCVLCKARVTPDCKVIRDAK